MSKVKPGKHLIAIIDLGDRQRVFHRTRGIPRVGEYIMATEDDAFLVERVIWPSDPVSEISVAVECAKVKIPQ
ncbi:MAG TPA: hypothetical protein VJM34_09435 [Novosphingobium sp.]|nr:hypothetical protein [Novosphingobium sp.]